MKCPKCAAPLVAGRLLDIDVDRCPRCAGVWLDHDELDQLEDHTFDVDEWKGTLAFELKPTVYPCPRCSEPLARFNYRAFGLELECCRRLHGYWLDAGEDARILELMRRTKADALRTVDAEERWRRFRSYLRSPSILTYLRDLFLGF